VVAAAELRLIDAARCLAEGDPLGAVQGLEQALALTGDPLAAALLDFVRAPLESPADPALDGQPETSPNSAESDATPAALPDDIWSSVGRGDF
jgi:hypothetical protein